MNVLRLRENRGRAVHLRDTEAAALVARSRGRVEVTPTTRRGVWFVRPRLLTGVMHTGFRAVEIRPARPLANLLHLLDPSHPAGTDLGHDAEEIGVADMLAVWFAGKLEGVVAAGLHRGYREEESAGEFVQGRIDVAATLRQAHRPDRRVVTRADEFTADVACNRLVATVARRLAGVVGDGVRGRLARCAGAFDGVAEFTGDAETVYAPERYSQLIELCRTLYAERLPDAPGGGYQTPSLLVSTDKLFEAVTARAVRDAFAGGDAVRVHAQKAFDAGAGVVLRPDVTVERGGEVALVLDAKWKSAGAGPDPGDLYQAIAYSAVLGARAVLVYPGGGAWGAAFGGHRVDGVRLRVSGGRAELDAGRERFGRAIRAMLTRTP